MTDTRPNRNCPVQNELEQFSAGAIASDRLDWIEQHLTQCDACLTTLASFDCNDALLSSIARGARRPGPSCDDAQALHALIERVQALFVAPTGDTHPMTDGLQPSTGVFAADVPSDPTVIANEFLDVSDNTDAAVGVGRYRGIRVLGRGGMGVVFEAEDVGLKRRVAIKEISPYHAHRAAIQQRFVREAEITGGLEHPGIVPVYCFGRHADGRPFYAMRFLKGNSFKTAVEACHENRHLATESRDAADRLRRVRPLLRRFVDVCNAVAYAHSRGVLHRDLKPANIMLGEFGETLVVDWGVAKSFKAGSGPDQGGAANPTPATAELSGELAVFEDGQETVRGSIVGTPEYMSPEQAEGRLEDLGPASDVYSLGATLYHLLVGSAALSGASMNDVLRKVRSGKFRKPRQVNRAVPAALEAVCLRAMALRPENRYGSARELADEIERWLADEPVQAWPESWWARLGRWLRRHRAWAYAAGLAALLIGLVSTIAAIRVNDQKLIAESKERLAEDRTLQFGRLLRTTTQMLLEVDPIDLDNPLNWGRKPQLPPERLLQLVRDAQPIAEELADRPALQAELLLTIGRLYRGMGLYGDSGSLLRRAIDLCERHQLPDRDLAAALVEYGRFLRDSGAFRDAERALQRGWEMQRKVPSLDPSIVTKTRFYLAWTLAEIASHDDFTVWPKAIAEFEAVVRERLQHDGANSIPYAVALGGLGFARLANSRNSIDETAALLLINQSLTITTQLTGRDASAIGRAATASIAARAARNSNNWQEAERQYREAIRQMTHVLHAEHPIVGLLLGDMAGMLRRSGNLLEAEKAIRAALDIGRGSLVRGHPEMIKALVALADEIRQRGAAERIEARDLYQEALGHALPRFGSDHVVTQDIRNKLADVSRQIAHHPEP